MLTTTAYTLVSMARLAASRAGRRAAGRDRACVGMVAESSHQRRLVCEPPRHPRITRPNTRFVRVSARAQPRHADRAGPPRVGPLRQQTAMAIPQQLISVSTNTVDPLQGAQGGLGGGRDRAGALVPGGEGLAGGEPGAGASGRPGGALPPGGLGGEQGAEHLSRFPALRPGGGEHLGGGVADVGQAEAAQQGVQLACKGWRGRHAGCWRRGRGRRGHRRVHCPNPCQAAVPVCRLAVSPAWRTPPGAALARWARMLARSPSPNRAWTAACPSAQPTGPAPCSLASATALAIFTRTRLAPAAPASASHSAAPSPIA